MKKNLLLAISFLLVSGMSAQLINAQEVTSDQKEKEAQLQKAIAEQKRAIAEKKKAMDLQLLEGYKTELDSDMIERHPDGSVRVLGRPRRDFVYVNPGFNFDNNSFFSQDPFDGEKTTWDFSKYVKEATFSKQYSFDVEKTAESVVMTVMGDCKEGEIRVKIIMPGGKSYSDILIDESGNLNCRKSFTISDDENKDKAGEWLFKIDAAKATGSFRITLQTY